MQEPLNRSLSGVSKGAPGPDASGGMRGKRGKSDTHRSRPKSPSRPTGGGGAQKGDARGRSASAGKRHWERTTEEHLFCLPERNMCSGKRLWIRSHQGTWGDPLPQNLACKAKRFVLSTQAGAAGSERTAERNTPLAFYLQEGRARQNMERWIETSRRPGGRCARSLHIAPQRSQSGTE